ncbi:unnamed protein product [Rodentolepis nana]|uniref:SEA domain-containing protein n=1 Tax=Rodentolepis nana TaxID=102285 RepID=A0A0R3TQJ2_RODNA|nr:unnamed protein product [Rodentolepis nana]
MQLLVGCQSLTSLYLLFLSFTVSLSHCLPIHLPPDTTKVLSSTESSAPFATFLTTPMVTLNGAEIPMKVVPLEEIESRYFSYLTVEGTPTTLEDKTTTSAHWVDDMLLEEKTTVSTEGILPEEVKSTTELTSAMMKMSETSSIETLKPQELTTEQAKAEEIMISNDSTSGDGLKSVSTASTSPTSITNILITSTPEVFKSKDLITTAIPNPLTDYPHKENTVLQTIEPSDLWRATPTIPGTEQIDELKEPIISISNSPSMQESEMITSEDEVTTTTNLVIETSSLPLSISNSAPVKEATLLSTFASETEMLGSAVYSDLPKTSTFSKTLASIVPTQITMPNTMMTTEIIEPASKILEQVTTTKTEEVTLQEMNTIPIATATLSETKKVLEETSISSHNQEISKVGLILSTRETLPITAVEPQMTTTAQPLKSIQPLAQTTQNFHSTSIGIRYSEISEKTSSAVGVIPIQTAESVSPTISISTNNDAFASATTSSILFPTEDPTASGIKNSEMAITSGERELASQFEEPGTSIITTRSLPTTQVTQSTAPSEQIWTTLVNSSESIQDNASTIVKTDSSKFEMTSTEISIPVGVQATMSSPSESTATITTSIAGSAGSNTEMSIVAEVTSGAETKISYPTSTKTTASAVPEIILTSPAVAVGSTTEIPPHTPSSVTQMPTELKDHATTVHSIQEENPSPLITDVNEKTLFSTFSQSTTSRSLVPDEVESKKTQTAITSTISRLFSTMQPITTAPSSSYSITEKPTSPESSDVSDVKTLQSLQLSYSTTIAASATKEVSISTAVTDTALPTTAISPKDTVSAHPMVWTETEVQSTLPAEKSDIPTPQMTKATQISTSTSKPTIVEDLGTQPPILPDSTKNVEIATQMGHFLSSLPQEKPEITTVDTTKVGNDLTTQTEPWRKDIQITSSAEIVTAKLTQTTQAHQPMVTEKPPDSGKPPVDPNPQRPKDPDPEGMTLATAISMGLILIFLLILLCILAVSLIAGWIHCRGRESRQPKVSLIRVERGLATEFADSWSKGMSAQAWMTTQSGATAINPIPPTSSPQLTIQSPAPPHPQNFHCGCKRRGLFKRPSQLCLVHGDPSARHPASAVRAVKIISLSGNSDEEGENDAVLLTELGRRRASGASDAPGVNEEVEEGEEGDSRDIGKGRGEWLFIDEA